MEDKSDENEIKALESARKVYNAYIDRSIALVIARISALAEEEKPGTVECKVLPPNDDGFMWVQRGPDHIMDFASCEMHKDFIGFKYEDGDIRSDAVRVYRDKATPSITYCVVQPSNLNNYEVLTPAHVLFRSKK